MTNLRVPVFLMLVLLVFMLNACASEGPEVVVANMYTALNEGNSDAYLDTLRPAVRKRPDLTGIFMSLVGGLSVSAGPLGFDVGGLLSPKTANMQVRVISQSGDYALVEARGVIRIMMMEIGFCETHDVVRESGRWYIDPLHPARAERIERYMARNTLLLQNQGMSSPDARDPFEELIQLLFAYGNAAEVAFNLCD